MENPLSTRAFALILGILSLVVGIAVFIPGLVTHLTPGAEVAPGSPDAAPASV